MPLELPGKPLGRLPDKRHRGRCPACGHSYIRFKVTREKNLIKFSCPRCGKLISHKDIDQKE